MQDEPPNHGRLQLQQSVHLHTQKQNLDIFHLTCPWVDAAGKQACLALLTMSVHSAVLLLL